jgi:hypothetical protein
VPRRSCWPSATGPANCARTRPGSPASSIASRPRSWAHANLTGSRVHRGLGRRGDRR